MTRQENTQTPAACVHAETTTITVPAVGYGQQASEANLCTTCLTIVPAADDLSAYTETTCQVWVVGPGYRYAYRTDLLPSVARRWAESWNKQAPNLGDAPEGARFIVVEATTTFAIVG